MRLLITTLTLLSGCGTQIREIRTNPPPRALTPRPATAVEVYTGHAPERAFVEIAYLEAQQESPASRDTPADIFARLQERAGAIGCDAIYITAPNNRVVEAVAGAQTLLGYSATCLVYR